MSYSPSPPPDQETFGWTWEEFLKLQNELIQPDVDGIVFFVRNVAPQKYKEGLVVYADGTNWNPGSGKGLYIRKTSSWVFLG